MFSITIHLAVESLMCSNNDQSSVICSESLPVLNAICDVHNHEEMLNLVPAGQRRKVTFLWISVHAGISRNKLTDKAARQAVISLMLKFGHEEFHKIRTFYIIAKKVATDFTNQRILESQALGSTLEDRLRY